MFPTIWQSSVSTTSSLRLPAWAETPPIRVCGQYQKALDVQAGCACIERTWRPGDVVELDLSMEPRLTEAHPWVDAARGCVAIERGPVVYCLEQHDQDPSVDFRDAEIARTARLTARWEPGLLDGVVAIDGEGHALDLAAWRGRLYAPLGTTASLPRRRVNVAAVPYYAWANRGPAPMRVWIPVAAESPPE